MTLVYQGEVTPIKNIALYIEKTVDEAIKIIEEQLFQKKLVVDIEDLKGVKVELKQSEVEKYNLQDIIKTKKARKNSVKVDIVGLEKGVLKLSSTMKRVFYKDGKGYDTKELADKYHISKMSLSSRVIGFTKVSIDGDIYIVKALDRIKTIPYAYYQGKLYRNKTFIDIELLTGIHYKYLNQQYKSEPKILKELVLSPVPLEECYEQFKIVAFDKDGFSVFSSFVSASKKYNIPHKKLKRIIDKEEEYKDGSLIIRRGRE